MPPTLPEFLNMPFEEGLQNFVERDPQLADSAEELRQKYSEGQVFGATLAMQDVILERIQQVFTTALAEGKTSAEAEAAILEAGESFAANYAENIFRTNLNTAYTDGRIEQSKKMPGVVGFEFSPIGDSVTRDHHEELRGMRAAFDDRIWDRWKTPLEYNCRCILISISAQEAQRKKNALDENNELRRFHPKLGFDFSDSEVEQLAKRSNAERPGELPIFVDER